MRRKPLFTGILLLLLLVVVGFLFWSLNPFGPSAEAYAALQSDTVVNVELHPDWIVFTPIKQQPEIAFIFYPGGRVDYRSYAPMLREIAMQGYQVFMVRMPLNGLSANLLRVRITGLTVHVLESVISSCGHGT